MGRTLQDRIRQAAEKVLRCEVELEKAQQNYEDLVSEARERGIETPRTALTNPLMPPAAWAQGEGEPPINHE